MERFEPSDNLNEIVPNLLLRKLCLIFLVFLNTLKKIATIRQLHDDTQTTFLVLEEGLFVSDDIGMVD